MNVSTENKNKDRGYFHYLINNYRRAAFSAQLKSKVGLALAKAESLRITLNLDGAPITSKSPTHPSVSVTVLRCPTGPFPVSPVPVLAGEVTHRYRL